MHINPHDDKKAKGGVDGASLSSNMLAVADGVGGWANHGVDPGLFAESLCKNILAEFKKDQTTPLKTILIEAV